MLKITDTTGSVQETIQMELANTVGVWRDMVCSKHSRDNDEPVCVGYMHDADGDYRSFWTMILISCVPLCLGFSTGMILA
jgi:hypothetical protein